METYRLMKKIITFVFILVITESFGQNFWRKVDENQIPNVREIDRGIIPQRYSTNKLDLEGIVNYLEGAPIEFNKENKSLPLYIPMPNGKYELFDVVYSPVMMPKLAEKYPNIRSYKGFSRVNKGMNIRFKIGPRGFYASIASKRGNIYIDPFGKDVTDYCISYFTKDYVVDISNLNLTCGTKDDPSLLQKPYNPVRDTDISFREDVVCDSIHQLNYILAIACTGEWGVTRGTVEKALDDINTSVNRINQIYENEVGIHFILHEENDKLIWLDGETDPFENPKVGSRLLGEVHQVIHNTIGNDFDIGHIFTTRCDDVGGIANLGVVCSNGSKGRGVTCHYKDDLNYIVTNVTCHEMGHQFSAQHTFNYCDGENESSYGYEPGGGNSIMAYCGLCGGGRDIDYPCLETFHAFSIEQIKTFSRDYRGKKCADFISKSNTDPIASVDYENGFSIPIKTPFVLEGSAYDCEDDNLTYSWEQMNTGPPAIPGEPIENSPLFNVREPKDTPVRYFPEQYSVLYGTHNNSETLPTYSRDLDFRFLVRDNHANDGGSDWVDVKFYADGNAGPFEVTYPNSTKTHQIGDSINVTWNVANTTNENVNCQSVNVLLSVDKGFTFPYVLKYGTPNDGSATVFIPDLGADIDETALNARIKVEANDNIFYQVSRQNFRISDRKDTSFVFDISNSNRKICLPLDYDVNITTRGVNGYQDDIRFEIIGLPEEVGYTVVPEIVKTGKSARIEFDFDNSNANGHYEPTVLGISSNGDTIRRFMSWDFYSNDYSNTNILNPIPGSSGVGQKVSFKWNRPRGANYVNFHLSKNPGFPKDETISEFEIYDTTFTPDVILDYSTLYYWKLEYKNGCGLIQYDTLLYTFATKASNCKNIKSDDDPVLIRSSEPAIMEVEISEDVSVTDVNVHFTGKHTRFREISASLISSSDTVLLFGNRGFNYQGTFNLGFDDQASDYIKQPPKGLFKPDEPLSKFNGKSAKGKWYLQIVDNQSQKSGKLSSFVLEVCSDAVLDNPYIENNNLFKIAMDKAWAISPDALLVKDDNNTAEELEFTLVRLPKICDVYLKDKKLEVGDNFTQDDINNSRVKIYYHGNDVIYDEFDFTVVDGDGGWIDVTTFHFVSDDKVNIQEVISQLVDIYPNPTSNHINVIVDIQGNHNLKIYDVKGEIVLRKKLLGQSVKSLDLSKLESGFYFINIFNEKYNYTEKLVKE